MRHNEYVAAQIMTLGEPVLAGLCGSRNHKDMDALQLDFLEAVQTTDAPSFSQWDNAWDWYCNQLTRQFPHHIRLEPADQGVRVAIVS